MPMPFCTAHCTLGSAGTGRGGGIQSLGVLAGGGGGATGAALLRSPPPPRSAARPAATSASCRSWRAGGGGRGTRGRRDLAVAAGRCEAFAHGPLPASRPGCWLTTRRTVRARCHPPAEPTAATAPPAGRVSGGCARSPFHCARHDRSTAARAPSGRGKGLPMPRLGRRFHKRARGPDAASPAPTAPL